MKQIFVIALLTCFCTKSLLHAQTVEQLIDNGNAAYEQNDFSKAERFYEEAIAKDIQHQWPQATFNLGNTLYREKKYDEAIDRFLTVLHSNASPVLKAPASYNLGNCYLSEKNYEEAINAYKQTLLLNPHDEDARYNLSYAETVLNKQRGSSSTQPSTQEEPQPPKDNLKQPPLSQEDMNRLLNELNESENRTLKNLQKQPQQKKKALKDW